MTAIAVLIHVRVAVDRTLPEQLQISKKLRKYRTDFIESVFISLSH